MSGLNEKRRKNPQTLSAAHSAFIAMTDVRRVS